MLWPGCAGKWSATPVVRKANQIKNSKPNGLSTIQSLQTALGAWIMSKVTKSNTSWEKESQTLLSALSKDWPSIKAATQEVSLSLRQLSEKFIIYFLKSNSKNFTNKVNRNSKWVRLNLKPKPLTFYPHFFLPLANFCPMDSDSDTIHQCSIPAHLCSRLEAPD